MLTDNCHFSRALLLAQGARVLALVVDRHGPDEQFVNISVLFKVKAVVARLELLSILVPGDLGVF